MSQKELIPGGRMLFKDESRDSRSAELVLRRYRLEHCVVDMNAVQAERTDPLPVLITGEVGTIRGIDSIKAYAKSIKATHK
jgi:hypothetical protein